MSSGPRCDVPLVYLPSLAPLWWDCCALLLSWGANNAALPCPVCCLHLHQTLERSYLLRLHGKVVERPQHMLMRVAIGIHMDNIDEAVKTYHLLR